MRNQQKTPEDICSMVCSALWARLDLLPESMSLPAHWQEAHQHTVQLHPPAQHCLLKLQKQSLCCNSSLRKTKLNMEENQEKCTFLLLKYLLYKNSQVLTVGYLIILF